MKKFKVVVNGREYNLEIVEVAEFPASGSGCTALSDSAHASVVTPGPAPSAASVPGSITRPEPAASATAGGASPTAPTGMQEEAPLNGAIKKVEAPLAGTILSVRVKEGDRVKVGDVLVTLEALKLENEIASPYCGVVRSVNVKAGESVQAGAILVTVEELAS